ncbi:MAG: FAD-dependent oxidoreductase [Phycisphaerae bacterium]|nr:FAD-dependent oxidoreductase [Phycisphaerae bacterium]
MKMITITVDDKKIEVQEGKTVLEAAEQAGIYIPSLCYHPDLTPIGACRLCVVEIEGMRGFPTSCTTKAADGMVVRTHGPAVQEFRRNLIWLLLSEYPIELVEGTQFKKVVDYIGMKEFPAGHRKSRPPLPVAENDPLYVRDPNRCILCERCVRMCQKVRGVGAIGLVNRGIDTIVNTNSDESLADAQCRFCGACVEVCPTGALVDKNTFTEAEREESLLPCSNACPAGIDIPRYVGLIAEGKYQDAVEVIRQKAPLPLVLGCVCDHPCEEVCRRESLDKPIAIRALKQYAAMQDSRRWQPGVTVAADTGKKVAVVGSGPAGLTAAWFLRKKGYAVTIFEALPEAGGMMRVGIPRYRLPAEILDREIADITAIGVDLKTNTAVGSLDELFADGFDAVYLGIGAVDGTMMGIDGEDDARATDGIALLRRINLGEDVELPGRVVVVGGGNVAIDVCRSALRKGADKVTLVYRRTRAEMPAEPEEIQAALDEGVEMNFLTNPLRIHPRDENLQIECIRMELGKPDASGRRRPVPVDGSEFKIEGDWFVAAIGQQSVVPEAFGVDVNKWSEIQVNENAATSRQGVFAGGDIAYGPASVIKAINAGRVAATAIDKYLDGDGDIDQKYIPDEQDEPYIGRVEGFAEKDRLAIPELEPAQRTKSFCQVELGYDEQAAVAEASRCLRCQLRLGITTPPLPPEK